MEATEASAYSPIASVSFTTYNVTLITMYARENFVFVILGIVSENLLDPSVGGRYAKTKATQKADSFERDVVCFSRASGTRQ